MEPCLVTGLPHHRTIAALDIEQSTTRTDPVKADLRDKMYGLFDEALRSAGIQTPHRDPFIDRGDGVLGLIHPVEQAPKAILLNHAIPTLNRLLTDCNATLPQFSRPQRQLRAAVSPGQRLCRFAPRGTTVCRGELRFKEYLMTERTGCALLPHSGRL